MDRTIEFLGEQFEWEDDYTGDFQSQGVLWDSRSLLQFIKDELSFWQGVIRPLKEVEKTFPYARQILSGLKHFERSVGQLPTSEISENAELDSLYSNLKKFYKDSHVPLKNSIFSWFLKELSESEPIKAIYCLEVWLGDSASLEKLPAEEIWSALMRLKDHDFLTSIGKEKTEEESSSLVGLRARVSYLMQDQQRFQEDNIELKKAWKEHKIDEGESLLSARKNLSLEGNKAIERLVSRLEEIEGSWKKLKSDMANAASALKNEIALDVSRNYWGEKATNHMWMSVFFGFLTCFYFIILGCFVWYLFGQLPVLLGGQSGLLGGDVISLEGVPIFLGYSLDAISPALSSESNLHLYAVQAALGLASSTLIFWVGRLLTRLFLSEHHLRIDAGERVVMMKTYLAFTAKGKMTEKQISLLLAPLFRPTADGIVKDDAAPEFSLAAFLSKSGTSS